LMREERRGIQRFGEHAGRVTEKSARDIYC
jgi:hypothetical protein